MREKKYVVTITKVFEVEVFAGSEDAARMAGAWEISNGNGRFIDEDSKAALADG